jgi:hypothetical protein
MKPNAMAKKATVIPIITTSSISRSFPDVGGERRHGAVRTP